MILSVPQGTQTKLGLQPFQNHPCRNRFSDPKSLATRNGEPRSTGACELISGLRSGQVEIHFAMRLEQKSLLQLSLN